MTKTVVSADGTRIAYEVTGRGPALLLVDGAMCSRAMGPARPIAAELAGDFTVYSYDRRGRGETPNAEFSVTREIEDVAALVKAAGGAAFAFGQSSGAMLALVAAEAGIGITKLAMYEAPLVVDDQYPPAPTSALADMRAMVEQGRRSAAVSTFMKSVGVPAPVIWGMRLTPPWRQLKRVAHTLPNDLELLEGLRQGRPLPTDRWTTATMPTLVASGGKSPAYLRNSAKALAGVLPNAVHRSIEGQTHVVKPKPLAAVLRAFFLG